MVEMLSLVCELIQWKNTNLGCAAHKALCEARQGSESNGKQSFAGGSPTAGRNQSCSLK